MFEKEYPYLALWVNTIGWIEVGADEYSSSLIRILNEGGLIWEDTSSPTLNDALQKAESYLENELPKEFGIELEIE